MRPRIRTNGARYFNFVDLEKNVVDIEEIAHALSNICRFTGHCYRHYSVAQHSVLVSRALPPEHALAGLLHDIAEAYLGDVAKPLKNMLPDFQAIERRVEAFLFPKFGLPAELPAVVKHADLVLLATERRDLLPPDDDAWESLENVAPLADEIIPWHPTHTYGVFIERFYSLMRAQR